MTMKLVPIEADDVVDTDDGRRVLLVNQQVVAVSAMAAVLLDVVADGETDLDRVAQRLTEVFGSPPGGTADAVRLTEEIARDLAARHVLSFVSEA
jgi:hypothetical protein